MTSALLREEVERELLRLHLRGRSDVAREFLALDHGCGFPRLEGYLARCRELLRKARELSEEEFALLLRYLVGRTLAFPLDRPSEALADLVPLCAELAASARRGGVVHRLAELELLRAFHKIDAPGYRDSIVAGLRGLWPKLRDDLGPQTELLDVLWRTGYWCRDAEILREARRMAGEATKTLRFSASYWHARELALQRRHDEAVALLLGLLEAQDEVEDAGEGWRHYLTVELAANEAELGRPEEAGQRLDRVVAELGNGRDPMLLWELARARAGVARAERDDARELTSWLEALDVVEGLGTDRLAGEFAVAAAEAAARCGDRAALARARAVLDATLPTLRSAADLREQAARVPGLYS